MKIIINGKFLTHKVTGVERYAREILNELDKISNKENFILAVPSDIIETPLLNNIKIKKIGKFHNNIWEQVSLPKYVRKSGGILLNLCNSSPLIKPGIVCIHDVKIKATPRFFNIKFLIWYRILFYNSINRAEKIITVSNFSKNEIVKYYRINPKKITIIPNSWQHFEKVGFDDKVLEKFNLQKNKFIFTMSSLEPNKNLKWIIEEAKFNTEFKFVVSGKINSQIFANDTEYVLPNNLILLGYVSDEEAKTLMRDCYAFVFPTFYEGFGIPPLEAMSVGTKRIIVSDINVMHEIFDDVINFINPYKYDYKFSDFKINEKDISILNKYSWKKSANKLLNELKKEE